ncbi:hypothetical protein [Sulfitobacter noctilucae]|uniref:hypothetical protein n=1 Tax=Sulfitobacter noctilucae TaxID=1342302 RepID=UPI0012687C4E|nr:hypothetical protein [Sulfitobacter noctilucae]
MSADACIKVNHPASDANTAGQDPLDSVGKVAESKRAEAQHFRYEAKAPRATSENGCLVDTPTNPSIVNTSTPPTTQSTRLTTLLQSPEVQAFIAKAKAQNKREETRAANLISRKSIPTTKWKRATPDEKFRYAGHWAERAEGKAFSLNLSPTTQDKLRIHDDPLRAFSDILNRQLKAYGLFGISYALTLEDSKADKLHVHGFLVAPPDTDKAVRAALRAAGGHISGRAGSRQLTLRNLSDGGGWAFYCGKDKERTNEELKGVARPFLNRSMVQAAREFSLSTD